MDLAESGFRQLEPGRRHPWERARLRAVNWLIERHARLEPGDVVLDVGCGDTFVVEQLSRRYPGVRFHAVDTAFTPRTIDLLRRRFEGTPVSLHRSLDDVPDLKGSVAVVLLMDVLEHVPDDRAFLRDLSSRRFVSANTRIVITVPAHQWLFSSHDRLLGHHRRYSMTFLTRQIEAAGLAVDEHGPFFASLLPIRALQVLCERVLHVRTAALTGLAVWRAGEAAARASAVVLALDARLSMALARAGINVPGLSTFAVCRKSA
jgi:SAM-dependent methyltransferase